MAPKGQYKYVPFTDTPVVLNARLTWIKRKKLGEYRLLDVCLRVVEESMFQRSMYLNPT